MIRPRIPDVRRDRTLRGPQGIVRARGQCGGGGRGGGLRLQVVDEGEDLRLALVRAGT